jgi:hypothetical protein
MQSLSAFFGCLASNLGNSTLSIPLCLYRGGAGIGAGCSVSDTENLMGEDGLIKHDSDFRAKPRTLG